MEYVHKPHFIEYTGSLALQRTFKAAVRYFVTIAFPEGRVSNLFNLHSDQIATLLEMLVNAGFMAYCGSFLSEYLYGMTRLHNNAPITWPRKIMSILLELVLPRLVESSKSTFGVILRRSLNFVNLAFGFAYAVFPKSIYPSFISFMQSLTFGKLEEIGVVNTDPSTVLGWLLKHGSLILYLSFKILQWYYVYEASDQRQIEVVKVDPPQFIGYKAEFGKNMCGICGEHFKDPACLETSGCCFCYICIYRHLQKEEKCPVSGIPSSTKDIRRIKIF